LARGPIHPEYFRPEETGGGLFLARVSRLVFGWNLSANFGTGDWGLFGPF
jgi:hypothetical protein